MGGASDASDLAASGGGDGGRAAAGMDALFDPSEFERAGFKVTRDGGDPGEMDFPLVEHDGYTLERDGRKLSVTYGRTDESGPVWQVNTYEGSGNVAYLDGDRPLDVGYLSDNFDRLAAGDDDAFEDVVDHGTRRDTVDRNGSMTDDERAQADLLLEQVRVTGRYDMDVDDLTDGQCEYIARKGLDSWLDRSQLERHGFKVEPTRGYGMVGDSESRIRAGVCLSRDDGSRANLEYAWDCEQPDMDYWCLTSKDGLGGYFPVGSMDADVVERNWDALSSCSSHKALTALGGYGVDARDDHS